MEMKKFLFMPVLAVIAAVSFSCSKENIEGNETASGNDAVAGNDTESAYFAPRSEISASSNTTKTTLNGREILWADGDAITLFGAENGEAYQYNIVSGQGTTSASFGISELPDQQMTAYAVYPAAESALSGTSVSVNIPASQTYAADGFSASYPMAAVTSDGEHFTFSNLATVLSLPLKGDAAIKSITIEAKGGEGLAGAAAIDFADGTPVLKAAAEGFASSVTLNCDPAVKLNTETETVFNFILIPGDYSALKITVTDTQTDDMHPNGRTTTKETQAVTLKPGTVKDFGMALGIPYGWNLTGSFTDSWVSYIPFDESQVNGFFSCKVGAIDEDGKFKIRYSGDEWYGWSSRDGNKTFEINNGEDLSTSGGDISIPAGGPYDIYFDQMSKYVFVMEEGGIPNLGIVGTNNNWGGEDDAKMIVENGIFVAKNVTFTENIEFKIRIDDKTWSYDAFNIGTEDGVAKDANSGFQVRNNIKQGENDEGSKNIVINKLDNVDTYDIWFDFEAMKVWVMTAGQTPSIL